MERVMSASMVNTVAIYENRRIPYLSTVLFYSFRAETAPCASSLSLHQECS
jgi:hypothetical protein